MTWNMKGEVVTIVIDVVVLLHLIARELATQLDFHKSASRPLRSCGCSVVKSLSLGFD